MRAPTVSDWLIIDGIAPFFRGATRPRINWSKIPFADLEVDGQPDPVLLGHILKDFTTFCARASAYGFNAITLDDLAHLVNHPAYPAALRAKIQIYQRFYEQLFNIACRYELRPLITSDIMFFNETLDRESGGRLGPALDFLEAALKQFFARFPTVAGLVSRIGETDGLDVEGDFHSRLLVRSPAQARQCLKKLLPVFEDLNRWWIFRTWSVGAYRIGDLIWNRDTFSATFSSIRSNRLILSMKYGESDFFRYLPLNKQFFRGTLPRLVEMQARREYEGAGEYPAFIGSDYEYYRYRLKYAPSMVGVMVWCQTGGWTRFRRLTFGEESSVWNEINTWVAVRLFRDGATAAEAVESWRARFAPRMDGSRLLRLLRLSEEVINELLYIDEFARQKIFFRRLRVPPLLSVFWDRILINHAMRQFMRCFVKEGEAKVLQGQGALEKIKAMQELARELNLPWSDLEFMHDTFAILAAAREYYFRDYSPALAERLTLMRDQYRTRHSTRYSIHLDFRPIHLKRATMQKALNVLFRKKRGYRLLDRIFTIRVLSWIYPLVKRRGDQLMPAFSRKQAMGIDSLFK